MDAAEGANGNLPEIELIIKASTIDGKRKGACLFCHEYFMDLYLLAELKTISLKITTVDMLKPPPDFRSNFEATPPPILIDNGLAVLENEKIERHIMKSIPGGHNLFVQDKEVATVIENVYSKFKIMLLKKDDQSKQKLLSDLIKINEHLETNYPIRFLTGDTMCCFDCELMPKLQHIRVAGGFFANFHIPGNLTALWKYYGEMYKLDAFVQSCPADQDIINHYKLQQGTKMTKREELESPSFTNTSGSNMKQTPSIAIHFISNYTKYAISMRTSSLLSRPKYGNETNCNIYLLD
jgi:chloride intracellular channel protein 2